MSSKVLEKDHGWKKIESAGKRAHGWVTVVGIPGSENKAHPGTNLTLADIASINEYGSRTITNRPPARPFMRQAFDNNLMRLGQRIEAEFMKVIIGQYSPKVALARIGEWFTGVVKATITRGIFVANAPRTIAAKGSSKPLIDTGILRMSITHKEYKTSGEAK